MLITITILIKNPPEKGKKGDLSVLSLQLHPARWGAELRVQL